MSADPLWEKFRSQTPYHYSYNNPLRFQDGNGKVPGGGNETDTPHEIEGGDKETSVIKKVESEVETVKYIAESKVETVKHIAVNVAEGVENSIKEYGLKSYNELKKEVKGTGKEVHHLIEKRFATELGVKEGQMLSIALTKEEHQVFTNLWRNAISYGEGTKSAVKEVIEKEAKRIYDGFNAIKKELDFTNGLKK